jgi:predicted ATP-dependent endonuclease of OLD family
MGNKLGQRILETPLLNYTIKDFGPVGSLKIDFKDTPIVMLKGKNESGKSNVARALATLLNNTRQTTQKMLINDNAESFKVEANFDGYSVAREKGKDAGGNINSYELSFTQELLDKYKDLGIENFYMQNIGASSEPPKQVADLLNMGYDKETGEEFSYRRTGKMLLLATPHSANHKIVYNGLEASEVRSALKLAGEESKKLKDSYMKTATIRAHIQKEINDTYIPDITTIEGTHKELNTCLQNYKDINNILGLLKGLETAQEKLAKLSENLETINYSDYNRLGGVISSLQEYKTASIKLKKLDTDLSHIDTNNLRLLRNTSDKLRQFYKVNEVLKHTIGLESVKVSDLILLGDLTGTYDRLKEYVSTVRGFKSADVKLKELQLTAKDFEGKYNTCTNCGELMVLGEEE